MQNVKSQFDKHNKELRNIHTELEILPLGRLVKKGKYYAHVIDNKEVSITNKPILIQQLARKKYLLARKKQLITNIKAFAHTNLKHDNRLPKEIIDTFPATYQSLPISHFYHPSIEKWSEASYTKNTLHQENLIYQSKNGIHFRSKSERDIANLLEKYDLPYRYDSNITLNEIQFSPDFIIKNPYNDKTIIWEHFGAFHKDGYEQSMNNKMDLYLKHRFIENDNLIYTFEFHLRDHQRIEKLVKQVILQNQ